VGNSGRKQPGIWGLILKNFYLILQSGLGLKAINAKKPKERTKDWDESGVPLAPVSTSWGGVVLKRGLKGPSEQEGGKRL